jgi:two-component system phosphate regulon response regulator PhoB
MKSKILVVDDEPDVVELVEFNLRNAGFDVITAEDGEEALKKARSSAPDLLVLDIMLPEIDGFEVCKLLRRDPSTAKIPIIMLTAKAAEIDRVLGLEFGADDYLTKPFSPRELILRIKKLIQRKTGEAEKAEQYRVGALTLDTARHVVAVNDEPVVLTATEFNLLLILVQRRGRVQSRDQLLRDVWGYDRIVDTRTVDTHMRRLREKLGPVAEFLETVRNVGYRFTE